MTSCVLISVSFVFFPFDSWMSRSGSSLILFCAEKQKWSQLNIDFDQEPLGIAYHKSAFVARSSLRYANIYKEDKEPKKAIFVEQIPKEGIYVFGGKNEEGTVLGNLRVFQLGTPCLKWCYPSVKGLPPQPRHSHSMSFINRSTALVIYGGKDEKEDESFFNDFNLLNLESMCWVKCIVLGNKLLPRAYHVMGVYSTELIVFGGTNSNGYLPSNVVRIEIDEEKAKKLEMEQKALEMLASHEGKDGETRRMSLRTRSIHSQQLKKKMEKGRVNTQNSEAEAEEEKRETETMLPVPDQFSQVIYRKLVRMATRKIVNKEKNENN